MTTVRVQHHILYARKPAFDLLMAKSHGKVRVVEETVTPTVDRKAVKLPGDYDSVELRIELAEPVMSVDTEAIDVPVSAAIKHTRGLAEAAPRDPYDVLPGELAWPEEYTLTRQPRGKKGTPRVFELKKLPSGLYELKKFIAKHGADGLELVLATQARTVMQSASVLSCTSKMGTYSFNLPPGPPAYSGTCPTSTMLPKLKGQPYPPGEFICAWCYGLKGNYGSPLIALMTMLRLVFVESTLYTNRGEFIDVMVRAIRLGQANSVQMQHAAFELDSPLGAKVPNPNYFRIHDVGDFYRKEYMSAWFEVVRRCSTPDVVEWQGHRVSVPAVKFWAPTRMWPLASGFVSKAAASGQVPQNLALRPSALFFGAPTPDLQSTHPGYTAGSGGVDIGTDWTADDKREARKVVGKLVQDGGNGWVCPATFPPALRGGARRGESGNWVDGACARAYGPGGELPYPRGPGCRACWDYPDVRVAYRKH